ncbi:hypothetical protein MKZ38_001512 [Zalerion maritima]|uniref:Uncharacterized protein n=1 Tax=Zalerion maritima TaxID=339359 RepID=A0AAD5RR36_9PEZI|nr:hypothetical protein MKZ38_001512 [Zalerion maritima]
MAMGSALPDIGKLMASGAFSAHPRPQSGIVPANFGMGATPLHGTSNLALSSGIRPLILTPVQLQGSGAMTAPIFQISPSIPAAPAPSVVPGVSAPPMPVKKPKVPNAAQQQAYEAYIEWRKANQPGYAEECKVRQARRVMRAVERENNGLENHKPPGGPDGTDNEVEEVSQ